MCPSNFKRLEVSLCLKYICSLIRETDLPIQRNVLKTEQGPAKRLSGVKVLALKPDDLSSVPKTNVVKGENQFSSHRLSFDLFMCMHITNKFF